MYNDYFKALFGARAEQKLVVKVRLYGPFESACEAHEVVVENVPDVESLLRALALRFGSRMSSLLLDERGNIMPRIGVSVNGVPARFLDGIKTKVNNGDVVDIYPQIR